MHRLLPELLGFSVLFFVFRESKGSQPYSSGSYSYRVYYYVRQTQSRRKTTYYCCSGWRKSGTYCSIPICSNGCVHGRCTSPNTCTCNTGWTGSRCQDDVNECSSSKGGCQQSCINTVGSYKCGCYRGYVKSSMKSCKDYNECSNTNFQCQCASKIDYKKCRAIASCINTQGSYRCSCTGNGFTKISSSNICRDVDECSGNKICAQTCVNTIGSYRCACRHGYLQKRNGICKDIDECLKYNGECENTCTNTPGSRQCGCRKGFRLERNGRTCKDIDECREDGPCQHRCRNTIGSFTCSCKPGYQLNSDRRTCSDINECRFVPISNCQQLCTNTNGSYVCGCMPGFQILSDYKRCKDVDECNTGKHQCSQTCINTKGSYRCSCVTGYELKENGRACRALPCEIIKAPPYGTMSCTGMATNDKCLFACNHGYDLDGPSNITCSSTSKWNRPQPTCKPKLCDILSVGRNVIVSFPCYRSFNSSCDMRCKSGYYSTDSRKVTCDLSEDRNKVVWKNFRCYHVKNCKPNPCQHGGSCVPLISTDFHCDCSNTGYKGRLCEQGVIDIPLFPKLKENLQSKSLFFQTKPTKEIQILIHSDDNVVAQPKAVKVMKPSTKGDFTLTSKQSGLKVISYSVQGQSAKDYKNLADSVLFVSPETPYRKSIFTEIPILPGELPVGCHMIQTDIFECFAQMSSTLPWKQYQVNKQSSTQGVVHLITKGGKSIPLSLIGFDFPFSSDVIFTKVKQLYQLNKNVRVQPYNSDTCESTTIDEPQLMELIENDDFAAIFYDVFSKFTPPWLQIHNKDKSDTFDIKDIYASIGSKSKPCASVLKSSSVVTYEPNIGSTVTLGEDITLPDERGFCYAIDVCTSDVSFSLPSESTKAIKSSSLFQDMRKAGWDIDPTGAMFPGDSTATVTLGTTLWNGKQIENITSQEYKFAIRGKIKTKLKSKENVNISLAYQGDVFMDTANVDEVFYYGFEREITSVLKGKASLNVTTTVFSKQVTIHLPEKEVFGKCLSGGSSSDQGLFFVWKNVPHPLQGTPFESMVRPSRNQPVFVALEYQVQGGKQKEIVNINEYKIQIALTSSLLSQLKSIVKNPQIVLSVKREALKRWSGYINVAETLIIDIHNVIGVLRSGSNLNKFLSLISKLRKTIRFIELFCKVIESTLVKNKMRSTLVNQVKKLKNDIPQIPSVRWNRSTALEAFKKLKILFQGKICSKRTCFDGMNVILESKNSSFIIQGKVIKPMRLGAVIILKKDDHVFLKISKEAKTSKLIFNPTVDLMGIQKVVSAEIVEDTLSFQTSSLIFGRHQASMNVSAKIEFADWSLVKFHVVGKIEKSSSLPQRLQWKINNHVRELAEKTMKRIKNAESVAKKANDKLKRFSQVIQQKLKTHNLFKKENDSLFANFNLIRNEYTLLKNELSGRFPEDDNEIERQSCRQKKCERVCSTTNICTFEIKKLKIEYYEPNCQEIEKTIKKDKVVERNEQSFYVKPTFEIKFTGNCGGGFFKSLVDAIFGCDSTYESVRGPDEKVQYTKIWHETVTEDIAVKEFDCSNPEKKEKITDSFERPKLTCNKEKCIKIINPTCIRDNNVCINQTQSRLHRPMSDYEKDKERQFKTLKSLANKMEIAAINLEGTKAKLDKAKEELKMAKALKTQLEEVRNKLESAILEIKIVPSIKLGLRLTKLLKKPNYYQRMVNISDFTFDVTIIEQTKRQIPMSFTVKTVDGKNKVFSMLFDFDKEISFYKISRNIIKNLYEEKRDARRKRSIPEELLNKINKTVNNKDMLKILKNHRLCLKARNANLFYKDIVKSLDDLIHVREQVEKSNEGSVKKLISLYQTFEKISTTESNGADESDNSNEVFKSYLDYFRSLLNEKQNFTMTWEDSLLSWKTFLEILTSERSFSDCAGTLDCVTDIGEELNEHYLYESDFKRANEIRESLSFVKNGINDMITKNFTLKEFNHKVSYLKFHLRRTEDTNVLCGRKPEIIFASDKNQVVLENDTFTLFCNASSDTEVHYQWIHNNASVYQSLNGSLTIRNANTSHAGSYKCKAINRKGFITSNVTVIITVNSKPKITQHPNDTLVHTKDGTGLLLRCNATGDPLPDMEWFFVSHYPNSSTVKLNNDNGSFLYYDQPTKNDSGYYFCIASNVHGRVESKKGNVLVLESSPGQPRLAAKMNVTKACKMQKSALDCWSYHRENISDSNDELGLLRLALGTSLNSSISQVENISFVSDGLGNATVSFLYTSSRPIIEDITNQLSKPVDPFLESFAQKRKQLGDGLKMLYQAMRNKTFNVYSGDQEITGDPDSLIVWVVSPGCPKGQEPHSNWYMCVNCPPGTHSDTDGRCMSCPLQMYQYEQGQTECIPCDDGLHTKKTGATSPGECSYIRPAPPRNLQVTALNSSKLKVHWLGPKDTSEFIRYYLIKCNRPGYKSTKTEKVSNAVVTWTLTGLKKFTDYRIALYAVYSDVMKRSEIMAKTGEDVPDAAPIITQCIPLSYDSARITWSPIPVHKRNGIVRGYRIYYKAGLGSKWLKWQSYTIETGNVNSGVITGLRSFVWYCFKVTAFTSKGEYSSWKNTPCWTIKIPLHPLTITGRALSSTEVLITLKRPRSYTYVSSIKVVRYGKEKNNFSMSKACFSSSCVIGGLEENTLYYFNMQDLTARDQAAAPTIAVKTLN